MSTTDSSLAPVAGGALPLTSCADDPMALRSTFGSFPSGVVALSAVVEGGEPVVLIASSFQVGISLDPPLVLFAVQRTSNSWPRLRAWADKTSTRRLGISVLGAEHHLAARQLASKAVEDRFAGIETTTTDSGARFVHNAPVWLECSVHSEFEAGDHDVIVLEVHALGHAPTVEPLVWHGSGFRALTPKNVA